MSLRQYVNGDTSHRWLQDHQVPIAEGDRSLASSVRRRVITKQMLATMIQDAVIKDRQDRRLRLEEAVEKKVAAIRTDLQATIQSLETAQSNERQLKAENKQLHEYIVTLEDEKQALMDEIEVFKKDLILAQHTSKQQQFLYDSTEVHVDIELSEKIHDLQVRVQHLELSFLDHIAQHHQPTEEKSASKILKKMEDEKKAEKRRRTIR